ncbi:MAG TPA: Z1 domain-containing protein [Puia sp.]|nr:Z1 domain-containing protein [Puia sp.]
MSIIKDKTTISFFDITKFNSDFQLKDRYSKRLETLVALDKEPDSIKMAVEETLENIRKGARSLVIYGDPQSGKTEMMIALTAKLLDEKNKIIIHLLNDSVNLLDQNFRRFKQSGLSPFPKVFHDIIDPAVQIGNNEFVIFCKKNSRDLQKLLTKLGHIVKKVIIDDEADYASPNGKINKGEKTKINTLIEDLLSKNGLYVGVTATPARLDLNNTFANDHEKWVYFRPHKKYAGQDVFFPIDDKPIGFKLHLLTEKEESSKQIKEALFRFIVNVTFLNLYETKKELNFSFLIHTSRKKDDHKNNKKAVEMVLTELSDDNNYNYKAHVEQLWNTAKKNYPGREDEIVKYIIKNKSRFDIIVLNSDRNNSNLEDASNPESLFTIIIGGNIVSRGVTFNNLLSMFFTRDVRHIIQQDTYIQRARMFGARGDYLKYFELTIPETLYTDWHRCFVFHRLAIAAIMNGNGSPVWLSDKRISPASSASIDRSTVSFDKGEMGFSLFDFEKKKTKANAIIKSDLDKSKKLKKLKELLGDAAFPEFLYKYIITPSFEKEPSLIIHSSASIAGWKEEKGMNKKKIERAKGFYGGSTTPKKTTSAASHHLKIFYNADGKARLFYKFDGSIQFVKNIKMSIEKSSKKNQK